MLGFVATGYVKEFWSIPFGDTILIMGLLLLLLLLDLLHLGFCLWHILKLMKILFLKTSKE